MPDPRTDGIARFTGAASRDPAVICAFLGGSFAAETADAFSDLDLYVVTEDDSYTSFFDRRYEFVRTWLSPALLETTTDFEGFGFDMVHFIAADGVAGELALGHRSNFRVTHAGPHRVLVDKVGLLEGVTFEFSPTDPAAMRAPVEHALNWFWLNGLVLAKSLARGRTLDAARMLGKMRDNCSSLWFALPRAATADERELMTDSYVRAEPLEISAAVHRLIRLHESLGLDVAKSVGLEYPRAADAIVGPKFGNG